MPAQGRLFWSIVAVTWAVGIASGMLLLAWHDSSPGAVQHAPEVWPADSRISLSAEVPTLLMFAHPRCPCTRASLGELEEIVARWGDAASYWVIFYKPHSADDRWATTDLYDTAARIPGVQVMLDVDGREAQRFDALTSGQTLLYNPRGELCFAGGITFARGHAGDSDGRSSIESILARKGPATSETPTYGCPILLPGARDQREN